MVFISSTRQGSKPQHRHRFLSLFLALGSWERWKKQDSEIKKAGSRFSGTYSHFRSSPLAGESLEQSPGTRFSKVPVTFRARKSIYQFIVSFLKRKSVYTASAETSCMRRTSAHIKNMNKNMNKIWIKIKQLCKHKVWDFAAVFRVRQLFGTFEKRAPES